MRREFAANLVLLLAVNVLVKPVYLFGVETGIQNVVGAASYGRYAQWLSFAMLFGLLYDLGLQNFNAVTLSKEPDLLRERLPVLLSLKLAAAVAFVGVVATAAWVFGAGERDWPLVWLASAYLLTSSLLQLLRTNVAAQGNYRLNSLLSVVDKALLIVALGALLLNDAWRAAITVEVFFAAQIAALLVTGGLAIWFTRRSPGQRWLRWDPPQMLALARRALPYALILVLSTGLTQIDRVMIEPLSALGYAETGKYAGAYRLLDGVNMVGYMFATLLIPMFSKQVAAGLSLERRGDDAAKRLLRQAGGYIAAFTVGLAAWTSFHADAVMRLLYVQADASWGQTLACLTWTAVNIGVMYVYGSYLLARQRTAWINALFGAALVLNVALNLYLIPHYGAWGAALATVVSQVVIGFGQYGYTGYLTGAWRVGERAWSLPAYVVAVLGVSYWTASAGASLWLSLLAQVGACALVGIASGLLADPRALAQLVRSARAG